MKKVFGQTVRDIKRELNRKVRKVPEIERKVLDATSNDPWGAHGSLLADIVEGTRNYRELQIIMTAIWKRISDTGKNWRRVYKALTVLEYLVTYGSERVIDEIKEHSHHISTLSRFQYIDSSGSDQGRKVRKRSQSLVNLVNDKERIVQARLIAAANGDKFRRSAFGGYDDRNYCDCNGKYAGRGDDRNGYRRERDHVGKNDDRYNSDGHPDRRNYHGRYGSCEDYSSQEGRQLDQNFSCGSLSSYREVVSESQSSFYNESSQASPGRVSRPPPSASKSENKAADDSGSGLFPGHYESESIDDFNPRGYAAATTLSSPPVAAFTSSPASPNFAEMGLLCWISDSFSSNALAVEPQAFPSAEPNLYAKCFQAPQLVAETLEDPFGEPPFRAVPSPDAASAQQLSVKASVRPPNNVKAEMSQSGTPKVDIDYFGAGKAYPAASISSPYLLKAQLLPNTEPSFQQLSTSDQETDILAGILPPSGTPTLTFEVDNNAIMFQSLETKSVALNLGAETPFGQVALPSGGSYPPERSASGSGNPFSDFVSQNSTGVGQLSNGNFPTQQNLLNTQDILFSHGGVVNQQGSPQFTSGNFLGQQNIAGALNLEISSINAQDMLFGNGNIVNQQGSTQFTGGSFLRQQHIAGAISSQISSVKTPNILCSNGNIVNQEGGTQLTGGLFLRQQDNAGASRSQISSHIANSSAAQSVSTCCNMTQHVTCEAMPENCSVGVNKSLSQPSPKTSTAAQPTNFPRPSKDKFEPALAVWADTLSGRLVNLNISGPKTNPFEDIVVDFDATNRKETRLPKPAATPVTSTVTMGKAMGSCSNSVRAGASILGRSPHPMMDSGVVLDMSMCIGRDLRLGMGTGGGSGGLNPHMGRGMGMTNGMTTATGMSNGMRVGTGMSEGMNTGMQMNIQMAQGLHMQRGIPPTGATHSGYVNLTTHPGRCAARHPYSAECWQSLWYQR